MKISPKQYAKLIYETVDGLEEDQMKESLEKISKLIKINRDERKIGHIEMEFEKLLKERRGLVEASVISLSELKEDELEEIRERIAKRKGTKKEKVQLKSIISKKTKGGLVIRIENEILDGSVLNKLNKLGASLR